ncbi:glutamyl-tRNA reductase [Candidatus Poribacteria bacterium]|nr:glutamyl-tRNA reductase [Candidatus Poribacteria bacterium]
MHCYLRGLNHKTAPAAMREKLALTADTKRRVLSALSTAGIPEAVILATCNRTEFYVAGAGPDRLASVTREVIAELIPGSEDVDEEHWYEAGYGDAVEHLLRVAAGLDSMVLGEPEILGQVREAWDMAREVGSTGAFFNEVFQRCFRVAKRVRTETDIGAGSVSLASAAHQTLLAELGTLSGKHAVLLGTGEIAAQVVKYLSSAGLARLSVVSRTLERAEQFAARYAAEPLHIDQLPYALADADALVTATACPTPLVTRETGHGVSRRIAMVDLAHPRNIAADVGDLPGVTLHAIDDLKRKIEEGLARRRAQAPIADAMVRREVHALASWHCSRPLTQMVKDFRLTFEKTRMLEMTRAAADASDAEIAALDEVSRRLLAKLLHDATLSMKSLDLRDDRDRERLAAMASMFSLRSAAIPSHAVRHLEAAD